MTRRWPFVAALVLGIGLMLAPVAFQMFSRAPQGGEMLDGFGPYMSEARISSFTHDLDTIGAARDQAVALAQRDPRSPAATSPTTVAFEQQWPAIDADMRSMLSTMKANIGHYQGIAALPPFALFPWFFVLPGAIIAGCATLGMLGRRRGSALALGVLGVLLITAPIALQLFTRAPGGEEMIDGFKPFMTQAKVLEIQGYFLAIGGGEADLRLHVLPALDAARVPADETAAIAQLGTAWPAVSADMAPMIGAMVDNIGRFRAVAALPPFGLFPWFFVAPGAIAIALAAAGVPRRREPARRDEPAGEPAGASEMILASSAPSPR